MTRNEGDPLQQWEQIKRERQRQKQKAVEQKAEQQRQAKLAEQQRKTREAAEKQRLEQKRKNELSEGQKSCRKLELEAQNMQLRLRELAKDIRMTWAKQISFFVGISVYSTAISEPKVTLNDNGTQNKNQSRVGWSVHYAHSDVLYTKEIDEDYGYSHSYLEGHVWVITERVLFGIGYFTDRYDIAEEARHLVTDEDLRRGVKAYFVGQSYNRLVRDHSSYIERYDSVIAIPIITENAQQRFFEHIFKSVENLAPENILPQAKNSLEALRKKRR